MYLGTHLILSVEIDPATSVEGHVAEEARFVSAPREHRQWDRNGHVDSNLANFDTRLELACSRAALREDGCSVTVLVGVDDVERVIEGVGGDDGQDGTKDFLAGNVRLSACQIQMNMNNYIPVAPHVSRSFKHSGSDPVSIRIVLDLEVATVERDLPTLLLRRGDQADDSLLSRE